MTAAASSGGMVVNVIPGVLAGFGRTPGERRRPFGRHLRPQAKRQREPLRLAAADSGGDGGGSSMRCQAAAARPGPGERCGGKPNQVNAQLETSLTDSSNRILKASVQPPVD